MTSFDRARKALAGTIAEIEEARRDATAELIAYKAGEKLMAARAQELADEAARWEQRAQQAVRAGDDALAREALGRRAEVVAELARVRADREEQAHVAAEMLRARRELDAALERLKLREGTVASGLAAPIAPTGEAWDRLEDMERKIDLDEALAELSEGEIDPADLARQKIAEHRAESALEELKRKMKDKP